MFLLSLFGLTVFFVSLVVFRIARFFWRCATSPLHELPGPASTSWLYGNVREFIEAGQAVLWDHWTEIYGNTFKFSTFFGVSSPLSDLTLSLPCSPCLFNSKAPALYTTDTTAMNYVLSHQDEFVKPTDIKIALTLLGEGMYDLSDRVLRVRLRDYSVPKSWHSLALFSQASCSLKAIHTRNRFVRLHASSGESNP